MGVLLKVTDLSYRQRKHLEALLQNIGFTVATGELVLIRGGSGSGKTTLAELLAGLITPNSGRVERPASVALVAQRFLLYQDLTVRENLEFYRKIHEYQGELQPLLRWAGLERWEGERAGLIPVGCQKMLQLCVALTRESSLIIMDEPTVGLDGRQMAALTKLLPELTGAGKGVLILTADGADCEIAATRVYRLRDSRLTSDEVEALPNRMAEERR
jgi:ABC-type multidrug transport system ATPase subunit